MLGLTSSIITGVLDAQSLRNIQGGLGQQRAAFLMGGAALSSSTPAVDEARSFDHFSQNLSSGLVHDHALNGTRSFSSIKEELQHETDQWLKDVDL